MYGNISGNCNQNIFIRTWKHILKDSSNNNIFITIDISNYVTFTYFNKFSYTNENFTRNGY